MFGYYLFLLSLLLAIFTVSGNVDPSSYGPKIQELVNVLHSNCIARSGTDEASIKNVVNGQFTDEPKIKVYMRCLLTDSGVIDENGNFNLDIVKELVPPKILDVTLDTTNTCDAKTNGISKVEDRVFAFLQCAYNTNPEVFIFF